MPLGQAVQAEVEAFLAAALGAGWALTPSLRGVNAQKRLGVLVLSLCGHEGGRSRTGGGSGGLER